MPSSKSSYPAYDKARTAFNRHLRARRDIIQERYARRFEALRTDYRDRFEEANAVLLSSSEAKMPESGGQLVGVEELNAFLDANEGVICSGNMAMAWAAAKVRVVIGIDSDSQQFGTASVVTDLGGMPAYTVPFEIRGDPVKDDAIMFGDDVDDHLRHGLMRVVVGDCIQAMRMAAAGPERWMAPADQLHPKVGYLWAVLHHPLHAHQIRTAAKMLRDSHRRGSPDGLLGLDVAELLTPSTTMLHVKMEDDRDATLMRDSAMLHAERNDGDMEWKRNTFYRFSRGKVDRSTRSRTWSQMEIPIEMPETIAAAAAGRRIGDLIGLPGCGDARTDEAVAAMTISHARNDGHGGAVVTLDPVRHIPLVPPPAGVARVVAALAPFS